MLLVIRLRVRLLAQILLVAHACALIHRPPLLVLPNLDLCSRLNVAVFAQALELLQTLLVRLHWYDGERICALLDAIHHLLGGYKANYMVVQNLPCALAVRVRHLVFHDLLNILASILEDEVRAARVVVQEGCDVVDLRANSHVAGLSGVVRGHLSRGKGWEGSAWHCRVQGGAAGGTSCGMMRIDQATD